MMMIDDHDDHDDDAAHDWWLWLILDDDYNDDDDDDDADVLTSANSPGILPAVVTKTGCEKIHISMGETVRTAVYE